MVRRGKLIGLQWLRGFAALLVIMAHAQDILGKRYAVQLYDGWIGGIGVDIFFVISGFIMFGVMDGQPAGLVSAQNFAARRIGRILPIYWLMIAIVSAIWGLFGADMYSGLTWDNGALRFTTSFAFIDRHPIVAVGWTLCFEMMFYGLSTLIMLIASRQSVRLVLVTLVLATLVLGRAITGISWFWPGEHVVLEFAVGGLIWFLHDRFGKQPSAISGIVMMAGGLLTIGFCYGQQQYNHGDLPWVIASSLLVAGVLLAEPFFARSRWQLPTIVGDASYSLYLIHLYALFGLFGASFDVLAIPASPLTGAICTVVAILMICALSIAVFRHIESPLARAATTIFLRLGKQGSKTRQPVPAEI